MHTNTNTATGMPVRSYAQRTKGGRGIHRPRENTLNRDRWNTFYRDRENAFFIEGPTDSHTPSVSRAAVSTVASAIKADKVQQTAGETQTQARLSMKLNTPVPTAAVALRARIKSKCARECTRAHAPQTHARERHGTQGANTGC